MIFLEKFGIAVLLLLWGAQMSKPSLMHRLIRTAWISVLSVIFGLLIYFSLQQYFAWEANTVSKFLLPPYRGIGYFVLYIFSRLWGPWLIALGAGFLCGAAARVLNRRFGERFFESEEPQIFALGIFLAGYPGFLFYIVLMLALGAMLSAVYAMLGWGRAPLYYLWLPGAVFAIIIESWFVPESLLNTLAL